MPQLSIDNSVKLKYTLKLKGPPKSESNSLVMKELINDYIIISLTYGPRRYPTMKFRHIDAHENPSFKMCLHLRHLQYIWLDL